MIHVENGSVSVNGDAVEIASEISIAIRMYIDLVSADFGREVALDMVGKLVELAIKDEETVHAEAEAISNGIIDLCDMKRKGNK